MIPRKLREIFINRKLKDLLKIEKVIECVLNVEILTLPLERNVIFVSNNHQMVFNFIEKI